MDSEDKLFWFLAIFVVIALTILAAIFIPLSIQKKKSINQPLQCRCKRRSLRRDYSDRIARKITNKHKESYNDI